MRQILQRQFGAPPPDTLETDFQRAIQAAIDDGLARSKEMNVSDWNVGCDGSPVVSVGAGTDCHAIAAPGQAGAKKFLSATPLKGNVVQVVPLVGRAFNSNAPYGGGASGSPSTASLQRVVIPVELRQPLRVPIVADARLHERFNAEVDSVTAPDGSKTAAPFTEQGLDGDALKFVDPDVALWGIDVGTNVASLGIDMNAQCEVNGRLWHDSRPTITTPEGEHTAVLLASGKVLRVSKYCELFDRDVNTWAATGDSTRFAVTVAGPTVVLLADGKVLACGGWGIFAGKFATVYDPGTEVWTNKTAMLVQHVYHTATLLPSGKVLVAGGIGRYHEDSDVVEAYDPAANTWTGKTQMLEPRVAHTATLLQDGTVLVVGGYYPTDDTWIPCVTLATAEIYDPTANTWTATGSMSLNRCDHRALLLPDGRVLVTGGSDRTEINAYEPGTEVVEIYDPTAGTWSTVASCHYGRVAHGMVFLADGTVLLAGGIDGAGGDTAEIYDVDLDTWTDAASMARGYTHCTAITLGGGDVVLTGYGSIAAVFTAAPVSNPLFCPVLSHDKDTLVFLQPRDVGELVLNTPAANHIDIVSGVAGAAPSVEYGVYSSPWDDPAYWGPVQTWGATTAAFSGASLAVVTGRPTVTESGDPATLPADLPAAMHVQVFDTPYDALTAELDLSFTCESEGCPLPIAGDPDGAYLIIGTWENVSGTARVRTLAVFTTFTTGATPAGTRTLSGYRVDNPQCLRYCSATGRLFVVWTRESDMLRFLGVIEPGGDPLTAPMALIPLGVSTQPVDYLTINLPGNRVYLSRADKVQMISAPWTVAGASLVEYANPGATIPGVFGAEAPPSTLAGTKVLTASAPYLVGGQRRRDITITWTYTGVSAARGAQLVATLALGWTFVSATGGGTVTDGIVTWELGDIVTDDTGAVTLTVAY